MQTGVLTWAAGGRQRLRGLAEGNHEPSGYLVSGYLDAAYSIRLNSPSTVVSYQEVTDDGLLRRQKFERVCF